MRASSRPPRPAVLGLAALLAVLVAAVLPDGTYELEPGELSWWEVYDLHGEAVQVLPVDPGEPFTIVVERTWVPCFGPDDGEPLPEAWRAERWDHWSLSVDGVPIDGEGFLIPCPGEPVQETQAVVRWAFPKGLAGGTYRFELLDETVGGRGDDALDACTFLVTWDRGDADGGDGADGSAPIVVPRPDRVETGAGGTADGGVPTSVLLLLGGGVAVGARTRIRGAR
jgi:hypothetical protein